MLKFEKLANVGDVIKAFDFKPMGDRPDVFLVGEVIEKGPMNVKMGWGEDERLVYLADGYTVRVIVADANTAEERVGDIAYVPFEVDLMEWDERINLVGRAA